MSYDPWHLFPQSTFAGSHAQSHSACNTAQTPRFMVQSDQLIYAVEIPLCMDFGYVSYNAAECNKVGWREVEAVI